MMIWRSQSVHKQHDLPLHGVAEAARSQHGALPKDEHIRNLACDLTMISNPGVVVFLL